jgi:putative integral membrane protein (TIGR02587 family)
MSQKGNQSVAVWFGHDHALVVGLARALAGALIFSLPLLMTMEMWQIGFYVSPWRLMVLLIVMIPLLTGLSYISGFEETEGLRDDIVDAFVAILVAAVMATIILFAFRVITFEMPAREIIGKIAIQTFPGSVGAMLARDQMSGAQDDRTNRRRQNPSYPMELFLMAAGAVFLGLNVAATEEMVLLAHMMQPVHEIALVLVSLAGMHAFVYAVEFAGKPHAHPEATFWGLFVRFTVVGYAIVLLVALYLLWTFGRTDGAGLAEVVSAAIVLGFPCAVGAAAARLIL